ncbi:hypothetical protein TVAG_077160 [Trichomonas vaginalis G3]|uniref:Putative nitroreductase TM1586 domain-containing protein n=1 Tax=Trichomonas vaginalis (strain ATCC PRA-98 / G3) TaxID=412133 RepID=A2D9W3_TRIV3|nr:putative TM nitroreductase family [Trichomonas vaginalis G3]EAY22969.1 hypothetical protein TVAG_077160 [Trichomonas vaginalis G3]KAI5527279.1 putative TM nitroreductase family [Trichomonas vaginalis G3]|eukprot:XP_001583955.1 hypothetical protein [Trichomonas vaginalis G3]
MMNIVDTFMKRHTVCDFTGPLPEDKQKVLEQIIENVNKITPPHKTNVKLALTEPGIGTNDAMLNEAGWIVQLIPESADNTPDLEKYQIDGTFLASLAVMELFRHDIGTCWVAGTYNRQLTESRFPGYKIYCVVSYGLAAPVTRKGHHDKPRTRFEMSQLFYDLKKKSPITDETGTRKTLLECLRWLPSGMNSQSWRLAVDFENGIFKVYNNSGTYPRAFLNVGIMLSGFYFSFDGKCTFTVSPNEEEYPTGGKYYCIVNVDPSLIQ